MVDVYLGAYTYDSDPTKKYHNLYENVPIKEKLASVVDGKIEYILYLFKSGQTVSPFDAYPQYFTKIYDNGQATIFKTNKAQINIDNPPS